MLVEQIIKNYSSKENIKILDIGAGSGNISIALSNNLKKCEVLGIDISEKALEVAKQNAENNLVQNKIEFKKIDIKIDDIAELGKFDLIVSNPPYVSSSDFQNLEPELKDYEPSEALTDNSDGISFYKKIISSSKILLNNNGKIYFEIGKDQYKEIFKLMSESGFININIIKDYLGIERIICGELR